MANPTKQQQQAINRLRYESDFKQYNDYLRAELEETKAALVLAPTTEIQRLQGYAQMIVKLLELAEPPASTPAARTF